MAVDYSFYVSSANEIHSILVKKGDDFTDNELRHAVDYCCATFERLESDDEFYSELSTLAQGGQELRGEIRSIVSNVGQLNRFLDAEAQVMRRAGMSQELIQYLNVNAARVAYDLPQTLDLEEDLASQVREWVSLMRSNACTLAATLRQVKRDESRRKRHKRVFRWLLVGIGGAGIVAANATPALVNPFLSLAGIELSKVIGGGFIGAAVPFAILSDRWSPQ